MKLLKWLWLIGTVPLFVGDAFLIVNVKPLLKFICYLTSNCYYPYSKYFKDR